ncbi:MAG: hypothetical protein JXA83_11960 [Acidimicrobiales bacterium]|nr:hypothetical protein [Acidimicrobiales bacterium]
MTRSDASRPTVVELIGGGPGDPDLLTLRAESALAAATLVVTDATVAHLARTFAPNAEVIVSPAGGPDRESINRGATVDGDTLALLVGGPRAGERVVRLYRGDPWLHPAYAVESAILAASGVDHVTVPGPLIELAVPTMVGIPVTHRRRAMAVTVAPPTDPPRAVDPGRTLVTVADDADDAGGVAARLARSGDTSLPAAVVATVGGSPRTVRRGTLGDLARDRTLGAGVLVVGAVAADDAGDAFGADDAGGVGDGGEAGGDGAPGGSDPDSVRQLTEDGA